MNYIYKLLPHLTRGFIYFSTLEKAKEYANESKDWEYKHFNKRIWIAKFGI